MKIGRDFVSGMFSVLKITGSPMLYRYPYRNSGEAFRSDWQNISQDIESVMGRMHKGSRDE